jgi:hypothetical protein
MGKTCSLLVAVQVWGCSLGHLAGVELHACRDVHMFNKLCCLDKHRVRRALCWVTVQVQLWLHS